MKFFSFRRQDCSQYGAVNSLKLVSQSESGQRGNLFLLSGHDDGQLILWSVVSSSEVILISIILDFENILWSIDFREDFRKKVNLTTFIKKGVEVKISLFLVSIFFKLHRIYSIFVEIHHPSKKKLCLNFLRGGGVEFFCYNFFCHNYPKGG